MPRQPLDKAPGDEFDQQELNWWRMFALKIKPGGDMPRVGSMLLGQRYDVIRDKKYDNA